MNSYQILLTKLTQAHGDNSKSVNEPDWNQVTSWTGYVPKEIQKAWKDIPYETKLVIYYIAGEAYRGG